MILGRLDSGWFVEVHSTLQGVLVRVPVFVNEREHYFVES